MTKSFINNFNQVTNNKREEDKKRISELELKNKELSNVLKMENQNKFSYDIKLKDIKLGKNCRDINDLAVEELQESIKNQGQLQPVLISSDSYLICGFRRFKAISNLGYKNILACRLDNSYKQLEKNLLQMQYM